MPGRVGELAGGARADRAGTDEQDGRHRSRGRGQRKSGPSSSRQPPLVGGTPPLPRSFMSPPAITRDEQDDQASPEGTHAPECTDPRRDGGVGRRTPGASPTPPGRAPRRCGRRMVVLD